MNISEYIASGILENYVIGIVSDQEKQEVECLSGIYPEIKNELSKLQSSIESMAELYSLNPPENLKSNILSAIEDVEQLPADAGPSDSKVINLNDKRVEPNKSVLVWKLTAAASVLVIVMFGVALFYSNRTLNLVADDNSKLESSLNKERAYYKDRLIGLQQEKAFGEELVKLVNDPATMKLKMMGTEGHEDMEAIVYCDTSTNQVYMSSHNFPAPPKNMGYQLWAIVDGEPIDMGMLDMNMSADSIQKMSSADNVAAFAVTLEQADGSPVPTMDQMIALAHV